ncbi:IQ domain-containing protein IQM3 [Heracleum sosnowskyi]|uniref:IQ domain-containing protein IQM3 n=1 Tax=Heracleum sosnowskyi TaxID=360622 RepID=A0AAD8M988_9APIA|nr:IQ domain-containing protein IQM3 [Heracleum sosnowskyi]
MIEQCIKYLGTQQREHYEYVVVEGGFHHSSFLAGGATLAAERLVINNGTLKSISAYSGHYRPTDERLDSFPLFLKDNGVNLDEVRKASEDAENKDDGTLSRDGSAEVTTPESFQPGNISKIEDIISVHEETEVKNNYRRTLSGGLQSPRADVPKKSILERISSKKAAKSYQLGDQLTLKWSTGAGLRINQAAEAELETKKAYKKIDKLKRKHERDISAWKHLIAESRLPKEAIEPVYDDCNTTKYDGVEPETTADQHWRDEFKLLYLSEDESTRLIEPSVLD